MKGLSVVKRYARALFDTAESSSKLSELEADIAVLDELFGKMPQLKRFCLSPGPPDTHMKTRTFIKTAFLPYLNSLTARTVGLLEKNSRLEALPWLSECLQELFDEKNGILHVRIESAAEIDTDLKTEIIRHLEKRFNCSVKTEWDIRPVLLGGMRIHWQNSMLDMSVRGRLTALRKILKRNKT